MTAVLAGDGPRPSSVDYDPFAGGELQAATQTTAPQRELWMASKVGGDAANCGFNECLALDIDGAPVRLEALHAAVQTFVQRHEALRGTFGPDGATFNVAAAHTVVLQLEELGHLPNDRVPGRLAALERRVVSTPFDLEGGPLYRIVVARSGDKLLRVLFCAHHAVFDGWSAGVWLQELPILYGHAAGVGAGELKAPTPFTRYATLQLARLDTPQYANDQAFWLSLLQGSIKPIELPVDRPRPAQRAYAAGRVDVALDGALVRSLTELGARSGCTLPVTLLGAFSVLLYRLTGQTDIVVGWPAAGQAAVGEGCLVGHCVHTLPLRSTVDPEHGLRAYLEGLKTTALACLEHQQVTFSSLLPHLRLPMDPSRVPLIPVCFNLDRAAAPLNLAGHHVPVRAVPRTFESFELFVNASHDGEQILLECSYNAALFDAATVQRWMQSFETLVASMVENAEGPLGRLPVLPAAQRQVVCSLNDTARPLEGLPVHARISRQAAATPDRLAVLCGEHALTYGELEQRSNQLAHYLRQCDIGRGERVGVCLERSEQLLVTLLAVLKAGAAYVPMDPAYPVARLQAMAEDARVRCVVSQSVSRTASPPVDRLILVDELAAELASQPCHPPAASTAGEDLAYVIFTSGSTGRPKGVMVPHRALENLLVSLGREPGFGAEERWLALTTVSFDIAGLELYMPLMTGASVVVAERETAHDPERIAAMLNSAAITVMQATPATWRMLVDAGWTGRPGLRALCGGEPLDSELAAALLPRVSQLWNLYGPTETTIWSTVKRIDRASEITIGRPIDNTYVYVLSALREPVPLGSTGELWISGDGVGLGYIGRPEPTAERFVDDPFIPGERMYRTGDVGKLTPDGQIVCLGRRDLQVKIRGFRIEIGEIEAVLHAVAGVRACAVNTWAPSSHDLHLVAYVVPDPAAAEGLSVEALRRRLGAHLPPYMMPQHFVWLDALPLGPAGKVDRLALPPPADQRQAGPRGDSPRDDLETELASLWQEILGVAEVGLDDDFFALGGHSLLAASLVSELRRRFGVRVDLAAIFQIPTLRAIADCVREGGGGSIRSALVPLRREPGAPALFFMCGVHLYREAAQALGPGTESFGVILPAEAALLDAVREGRQPADLPSVETLAAQYVERIREARPRGPYHLAGVSFGGVLAYEMARQLRRAGEPVGVLALLDSLLPGGCHVQRGARLRSAVQRHGLLGLGKEVVNRILRRGPQPSQPALRQQRMENSEEVVRLREQIYESAMAAYDHRAPRYEGDALLFRATDTSSYPGLTFDEDLGWGRLVRGHLAIYDLPGDHLGILQQPNVARMAEILRPVLTSAEH